MEYLIPDTSIDGLDFIFFMKALSKLEVHASTMSFAGHAGLRVSALGKRSDSFELWVMHLTPTGNRTFLRDVVNVPNKPSLQDVAL
ncbi:hypothetical protein [uncultured Roseobacter sp.]|uniref:hypothetical protein n=1 Tax=uncultured Roseobacter sp. TaxID=114847 RepID=UPI002611783E|nr:hypothetical protein [uncultured Roseobacter sp.]